MSKLDNNKRSDDNIDDVNNDLTTSENVHNQNRKHNCGDDVSSNNRDVKRSIIDHRSLIAGLASGAITNLLLHPLDSVKTRLQAAGRGQKYTTKIGVKETIAATSSILKSEGWRALYQGLSSSVIGASTSWGLYFFIYNSSKNYFALHIPLQQEEGNDSNNQTITNTDQLPTYALMASSLNAGIATTLVTHPIWLVKTRLQLQQRNLATNLTSGNCNKQQVITKEIPHFKGTFDALWKIGTKEGIANGLYLGLTPSLFAISHGMIHFVLYDTFKTLYLSRENPDRKDRLTSTESFVFAASAKSIAALLTYPLQVIKTRIQDYRNHPKIAERQQLIHYNGMLDAIRKMYITEGPASFFRGILPHVIRVTPSGAITFTTFEFIMNMMKRYDI